MKKYLPAHYLLCLALFALNKLAENTSVQPALAASYLDDLLFLPLILWPALCLQRLFTGNALFVFRPSQVFYAWLYFCIVFEGIIPRYHTAFTADVFDLAAYGAGALYFHFRLNKNRLPASDGEPA